MRAVDALLVPGDLERFGGERPRAARLPTRIVLARTPRLRFVFVMGAAVRRWL